MEDTSRGKLINARVLMTNIKSVYNFLKPFVLVSLFAYLVVFFNQEFLNGTGVDHNLILRYFDALEWPLVIVIAGIVLRKHLPSLLNRAREIGPTGIKLDPLRQDTIDAEDSAELNEATTHAEFDLKTPNGRKQVLENDQIKIVLEKVYRNIFGTQIEALMRLENFPNGLAKSEIEVVVAKHKVLTGSRSVDVTDYMSYLTFHGLVNHDPITDIYTLTDAGRLFLDYLQIESLLSPIRKPY